MSKALEAFRTISEVADDLEVPKHVLRFWEVKFPQVRPMKRGGGRRYYRPEDLELLRGIRHLLHAEAYTIKGVQKILREQGVEHVKRYGRPVEQGGLVAVPEGRRKRGADSVRDPAGSGTAKPVRAARVAAAPSRKDILKSVITELQRCRDLMAVGTAMTEPAVPAATEQASRRGRTN